MLTAAYRSVLFHDDSKLFVFGYIALAVVLAIWLGLFWLAMVVLGHLILEIVKQHHYDPRPLPVLTRSLWELKLDIGLVLCGLVIGLYIGVLFGIAGIGAAGRAGAQAAARVGLWQRGIRGALLTLDDVAIMTKAKGVRKKGESAAMEPVEVGAGVAAAEAHAGAGGNGEPRHVGSGRSSAVSGPVDAVHDGRASTTGESPDPEGTVDNEAEAEGGEGSESHRQPPRFEPPHRPAVPPSGGPELWGGWAAPRWSLGDRASLAFTVGSLMLIFAAPLLTEHTFASTWAEVLADLHPFPNH